MRPGRGSAIRVSRVGGGCSAVGRAKFAWSIAEVTDALSLEVRSVPPVQSERA
jgi:hypothetical protein